MEMPRREIPAVVVAAGSSSKLAQHGLTFALRLSTARPTGTKDCSTTIAAPFLRTSLRRLHRVR